MSHKTYPEFDSTEERYVEWDTEFEMWSVFGLQTGHCYGQFASEEAAEKSYKSCADPQACNSAAQEQAEGEAHEVMLLSLCEEVAQSQGQELWECDLPAGWWDEHKVKPTAELQALRDELRTKQRGDGTS